MDLQTVAGFKASQTFVKDGDEVGWEYTIDFGIGSKKHTLKLRDTVDAIADKKAAAASRLDPYSYALSVISAASRKYAVWFDGHAIFNESAESQEDHVTRSRLDRAAVARDAIDTELESHGRGWGKSGFADLTAGLRLPGHAQVGYLRLYC